jgi:hypothetical protein
MTTQLGWFERATQWLLGLVRRTMMTNRAVRLAVLLVGHCFIRPSDFVGGSGRPATFHFKRFGGLMVTAVPAVFYGASNVAFFEYMIFKDPNLSKDAVQQLLGQRIFISAAASLLVMGSCYVLATCQFAFHKTMCRLFGCEKTSAEHVTFKFFLVKSTIWFAWLTVFAWLITILMKINPEIIHRIEPILVRWSLIIVGLLLLIMSLIQLCARNSRLAMLEIYLTPATYRHINAVSMLVLVTSMVLLTFIPRILAVNL